MSAEITAPRKRTPGRNSVLQNVTKLSISWRDVAYTVPLKGGKSGKKCILNKVSGSVVGGEMLAIMGPSGCGKTTLLDIVADRVSSGEIGGDILVNGQPRSPSFTHIASYVPQEDALMGTLTVRETLTFAAHLTVVGKTANEFEGLIEATIDDMGLRGCANARVGDIFFKGISGGQKRRVSMAIELISAPSMMILDEPTSGLDSASALGVMSKLVELTKFNVLVIATIHQPSSELFSLFDRLCLLVGGETVFFGPSEDALDFFQRRGHHCPNYTNPADFMLSVINTDFPGHADVPALVKSFKKSDAAAAVLEAIESQAPVGILAAVGGSEFVTSHWHQFKVLNKRNLINAIRNPGLYWVRVVMYTALSFLICTMYWDLGHDHDNMQDRVAMLFFVAAFMVFMSVAVLPFFVEGRSVFLRERANGSFAVVPWVASHFICGIPGIFLISLISSVMIYFPSGLHAGRFGWFLLGLFLSLLTAESFMSLVSACVPHYIVGVALGAGVYGMFMVCEGFLVIRRDIPVYWIWNYHMAFHTYSFRALMYNEFHGLQVNAKLPTDWPDGDALLEYYDMSSVDKRKDMAVLFLFGLVFEILFCAVLFKFHTGKR